MNALLTRHILALLLALCSLPALAVNYTIPGNMPPGCTGSGSSYTCPGGGNLGYNDTVTIASATPITVTVNGNIATNNARINQGGSAANLTLIVNGTLTAEYQAVINGNVQATTINGSGTEVVFGGNVTATGAITLGYRTRVAGNLSGASLTTGNEINFGGNVTTTGNLNVGYASTLTGSVTAGGTLRLNGNTQAPQCLRTTASSNLRLEWADRANGGVCCGALGSCTTSCVTNNSGAAMPALCAGSAPVTPPSRFNAFDTGTAGGSITGVIRTKESGTSFTVAVVALNTAGTGVATTFTGNVRVEVLDSSNNSGAMNSSTNCRASWNTASGTSSTTLSFASSDLGRKNVTITVPEAFRDARIRVSYPDTGTATATGCSTDNFAIRPSGFAISAADTSSSTANNTGTTRVLANTANGVGHVHKAGRPFTVRAMATNSSGNTTTNYTGTVNGQVASTPCSGTACGGTPGTLSLGTMTAVGGQLVTHTASYSEAGSFNLRLVDDTFSAVDASDGSTPGEREISTVTAVGRFVPDHFEIVAAATPVLRTFDSACLAVRSFTYLGMPFGYLVTPTATVYPRNFGGTTTTNYPAAKMSALQVAQTYGVAPSSPGLVTTNAAAASSPTANAGGTGTLQFPATGPNTLTMARPPAATVAPFSAVISLDWAVSDSSETPVPGNEVIATSQPTPGALFPAITFDRGSEFRYGQLKLGSAYGSELVTLAVPLETQYWDGTRFVTNAADRCTSLPTSSVSLANFRSNLVACRTAPSTATVTVVNGRGVMRLAAPGNGFSGSVEGTLQLGNSITAGAMRCAAVGPTAVPAVAAGLPWLQTRLPGGTSFDQNPSARFSFGQYRSPVIQLREMY